MTRTQLNELCTLCRRLSAVLLFAVFTPGSSESAWLPGGTPVCTERNGQWLPRVCADGAGGAYIAWADGRAWSGRHGDIPLAQVFIQRLRADGTAFPGWPVSGRPVTDRATELTRFEDLIPDGAGGALVSWSEEEELYLARILADGTFHPDWPAFGLAVSSAPLRQYSSRMASDGTGGVFLVWSDERNSGISFSSTDLYAQHISSLGQVVEGWIPDGTPVDLTPGSSEFLGRVIRSGDGGMIVAWTRSNSLRMQHLTASGGVATGWPADGITVYPGSALDVSLDEDGAGGGLVGWVASNIVYARRVAPEGRLDDQLVLNQEGFCRTVASAPGFGSSILFAWTRENAAGPNQGRVRAGKVEIGWPSRLAPGWPVGGVPVSTRNGNQAYSYESTLAATSDGGAFVGFSVYDNSMGTDIWAQRLDTHGTPAWGPEGMAITPAVQSEQDLPAIAAIDTARAILAWTDSRQAGSDIYAQLLGAVDGPVPTLLSLLDVEAGAGGVVLSWYGSDAASLTPIVQRRTESTEWEVLGSPVSEAPDLLRYEDRSIVPGTRYAYRLAYQEGGAGRFTEETWVHVPAIALSLAGFQPNPARGRALVRLTLPNATPATLEALDVRGRIVGSRAVGSLGPGTHAVDLDPFGPLRPGIYWLRLTQAGHVLTAKGIVLP